MSEKAFAIVNKGMEQVCAQELQELGCKNCETKEEIVRFEAENFEKLCEICYTTRTPNRITLFLAEIKTNNYEEEAKKIDFTKFLNKETTFAADYEKSIEATEDGRIIAGTIGELAQQQTGAKVNLTNPDLRILCFIYKKTVYVGIDFVGWDLGKRDYRIFLGHDNLKGNATFCLLKLAEYTPNLALLDPFCRAGTIAIEAAMLAVNKMPHFYNKQKFAFLKLPFLNIDFEKMFTDIDKQARKNEAKILCYDESFPNINAAKKNAKIAGVLDEIKFSRTETEWLDIKLDKNTVDRIVTYPPQVSKTMNQKKLEKTYDWFFKNSKFLLKKNGTILAIAKKQSKELLNKFAEKQGFFVKKETTFWQGKEELKALIYQVATC